MLIYIYTLTYMIIMKLVEPQQDTNSSSMPF